MESGNVRCYGFPRHSDPMPPAVYTRHLFQAISSYVPVFIFISSVIKHESVSFKHYLMHTLYFFHIFLIEFTEFCKCFPLVKWLYLVWLSLIVAFQSMTPPPNTYNEMVHVQFPLIVHLPQSLCFIVVKTKKITITTY